MSSLSSLDKNSMQPPPKRQRILPQGTFASPGSTQSRQSSSSSMEKNNDLLDVGPIFTSVQEVDGCSSIQSALGVPTRILFRRVGGDRKEGEITSDGGQSCKRRLRPLLSRQEAEQFLRLTLLAQEIDVLVDLSETVLSRRQFAHRFRREVLMQGDGNDHTSKDRSWKNPWLSTLGPILDVLEKRQSNPSIENQYASNQQPNPQGDILQYIHNELTRLYHDLQACGVYELERAAEQNRSLVASLTDILGYTLDNDGHYDDNGRTSAVRNLAREKRSLSKLQDLLAKRVRSLLIVLCHSPSTMASQDNHASADENNRSNDRIDGKQIFFDDQLSSSSVDGKMQNSDDNKNGKVSDSAESSILSLEEILVPLEVVCDELFEITDPNATVSTRTTRTDNTNRDNCGDGLAENQISIYDEPTSKEKEQQILQQETGVDRDTNKPLVLKQGTSISSISKSVPPSSFVENPSSISEASQRTVGAATTIIALAGNSEQERAVREKATVQPAIWEENSDRDTITGPEFSQSAVGAAATMMELATKKDERNDASKSQINGDNEGSTRNTTNQNRPRTQQYSGNDDGSFIEDPPSDGEGECGGSTIEGEATPSKSAKNSVGIFDVVDVLTPQSQSQS